MPKRLLLSPWELRASWLRVGNLLSRRLRDFYVVPAGVVRKREPEQHVRVERRGVRRGAISLLRTFGSKMRSHTRGSVDIYKRCKGCYDRLTPVVEASKFDLTDETRETWKRGINSEEGEGGGGGDFSARRWADSEKHMEDVRPICLRTDNTHIHLLHILR